MSAHKANPRGVVGSFLQWFGEPPADGESTLELDPLKNPPARICNLIEALRDPDALALFGEGVFELSEAALALGIRKAAMLDLVAGGKIRGLFVGGERQWLFSNRRVMAMLLAANQREGDRQGLRAAEQFFKELGYRGFGCDEQP